MKEGWEYKKLGEVCTKVDNIKWQTVSDDEEYTYIDLSSVDRSNCIITDTTFINKTNAPSRAKQIIKPEDVLFGTTRPTLKRVCVIGLEHDENICSTGFCVLRAKKNIVSPQWIFYQLLSDGFYSYIEPLQSGANYPAVSDKIVKSYQIPLPPLSEQQQIVEELDLLSSIIEKKKEQLKELDALAQSIFYDMFGDPVTNEKGWVVKKMGDICTLKSGNSNTNNSEIGDLPYVKVGDMNLDGNETFITLSSNYVDRASNIKNIFPPGTTIFPKRGGAILTNKKRLSKLEICCDLNVMGAIPNQDIVHSFYVFYYFLRMDFEIFANTGSTIPQINNYDIAPLDIAVPPMAIQYSFASKIEAIEHQKELIKQSIKETETLFNSRMDHYFN